MLNANPHNVVSIGDHARARARLTPQESAGVLSDCRDLAIERIARSLGSMFDRVEDDLFELAEKAGDRESQNLYLDARAQARDKRPLIEETFRRHFLDFFNRKVKGEGPAALPAEQGRTLALVEDEDLEQSIAVAEMAANLRSSCEEELFALSQRFGFLLERPALADEANPVSPEAILSALKDACDQIEAGYKVRLTLMRALEGHVAADLQLVYHDLNSHLVERHILPEIRPVILRSPASRKGTPGGSAPAVAGASAPAANAEQAAAQGIYQALAQLLGTGSTGGLSEVAAGIAASFGHASPAPATQGFVEALTRLHQPGTSAAIAGESANVLREIRAAPQSASLGTLDAMTIDIVAMLFDYVFEDRQIPASAKAVLGRLQIPTLKVALLDKAFFSSRAHPARRLLDRLAEASIGLDEASARGAATLAKIESIVARVLQEFQSDVSLFESFAADLDTFLAEQAQDEEAMVESTARLIEERERLEIARASAEGEVDRRLATRDFIPAPVRSVLLGAWSQALARAHAEHGEGSAAWTGLLATMDELLWSIEPKSRAEDRRRLVTGLPAMLRSLQDGLQSADVDEPAREAFLGLLVDCHADAVRAGLKGTALDSATRAPRPQDAPAAPALERSVVPAGDIQVEEIRLRSPRGQAPVRNVFTRTGIWTNVQRDSWVEFRRESGEPVRARLRWISPAKGVYLFTNVMGGGPAISVTPEALAEQMRRGDARLIDGSPLVDRAVDSMLEQLRAQAA
jgi:hypothetical protein